LTVWRVEQQGRDEGKGEEECAELFEHRKRWVVRGGEGGTKSDEWDDDTRLRKRDV